MHIKESVTFKGDRLIEYVNYGTGTDGCDGLPKATQALVFMLVATNSNWKVPVGYFLINGIGLTEKGNLVNTCIELVHNIGVQVRTLTFDGTHESGIIVHILLDAAHMLKLCRNTLGDWKTLYDESMKPIKWSFFQNLVSIQEEIGLYVGTKILMKKELNFLLTYKTSQDHLEMFFSAIRSRGGFNNNPTALQFESSFKRLLVHTEIMTSSRANCMVMDMTNILWVSSSNSKPVENSNIYLDMLCAEIEDDDLNFNTNQFNVLQQVVEDIVEYIAEFIVRKLSRKLICDKCTEVLTRTNAESGSLINIKSRGGLINPSVDVIYLCKVAERIFNSYKSLIPTKPNIINYLIIKASSQINLKNIFIVLADHFFKSKFIR
ncbi:hypothetical protein QTP88_028087 [Uroleucon formosanum]